MIAALASEIDTFSEVTPKPVSVCATLLAAVSSSWTESVTSPSALAPVARSPAPSSLRVRPPIEIDPAFSPPAVAIDRSATSA